LYHTEKLEKFKKLEESEINFNIDFNLSIVFVLPCVRHPIYEKYEKIELDKRNG
jgi:hypothetical protein